MQDSSLTVSPRRSGSVGEVLGVALRLGLTSFGGPVAHIGYFRREYVERRRWLDEVAFADLVALCQFLPGPASSELGIAIGTLRAGVLGGIAAWLGFTLPSAAVLIAFGLIASTTDLSGAGWVHGLKLAAVAVVAQAVVAMAVRLAPDWPRRLLAVAAAAVALAWTDPLAQLSIIAGGAAIGAIALGRLVPGVAAAFDEPSPVARRWGVVALTLFFGLLVALPLARLGDGQAAAVVDSFYRSGALVFGGGHVVLPLLHSAVVPTGWVSDGQFLAGYGAAQAVPGPLFTFSAFLGTVSGTPPNGIAGGALALVAMFLPAFLLIWGALPFWSTVRASARFRAALAGTNAAVVGLLAAALYTPVATSAIAGPLDVVVALAAFAILLTNRVPPIVIVVGCALVGLLVGSG